MTDHPNVERLRQGYAAFAEANVKGLEDFFAEDAVWYDRGHNPLGGEFHGRDAIFSRFLDLFMYTDGTVKIDLVAAFADDKFAVAIEHMTAERNGKTRDRHDVTVYQVKDGKAIRAWNYPEDPYEADDFLS